jgi:hypothetical protein
MVSRGTRVNPGSRMLVPAQADGCSRVALQQPPRSSAKRISRSISRYNAIHQAMEICMSTQFYRGPRPTINRDQLIGSRDGAHDQCRSRSRNEFARPVATARAIGYHDWECRIGKLGRLAPRRNMQSLVVDARSKGTRKRRVRQESWRGPSAYCTNRDRTVEEVIDADSMSSAVRTLVAEQTMWAGTATDLLDALAVVAGERVAKSKAWPNSPRALSGALRRAATFLRKIGINISFGSLGASPAGVRACLPGRRRYGHSLVERGRGTR